MYEKVGEGIFCIKVPLPKSPLKAINCYLIKGTAGDLLIDTGFRRTECREWLSKSLDELKVQRERLDVLATHIHSDHVGLVSEFAGSGCNIYLSEIDACYLEKILTGRHGEELHRKMLKSGFPPSKLQEVEKTLPSKLYSIAERDSRICTLKDGDKIIVGDYQLQVILVQGHSPGNMMLWDENHRMMFTGDHILFNITPNITIFADMQDSLGEYLSSLCKAAQYPAEFVFPGHRAAGNYMKRIREILEHHKERLQEIMWVVKTYPESTAYEIASHMSWNIHGNGWDDFPDRQKWYAVGESLSHLEYLGTRGFLEYGRNGYYCVKNPMDNNLDTIFDTYFESIK